MIHTKSSTLSLILVRNTVSHDARVLREATTLRGLGFTVLVSGVVSNRERQEELEIDGVPVVRLDPAGALCGLLPRGRRIGPGPGDRDGLTAAADDRARTASAADGHGAEVSVRSLLRQRLQRQAVTASFYLQGIALVRRTSPALVHANDYNTMWIGLAAKLLCGSRLIYDSHELWPDRNGRPEWRPWLVACEALFVRLADATITTSPGYAEAIAARYRIAPPVVVRNIPVPDRAADGKPADGPSGSSIAPSAPLAVYLGGLMPGRGLEQAIEALTLVPELRLRLIGPGRDSYRYELQRRIETAGVIDRAEVCPAVPAGGVLAAIRGATMGLMLIQPACRSYELTLPNKLFEYAAAGLPILGSDLPVIGPLVRDEGLGEVVPADDIALIARGLRRLADPDLNASRRARVRAFAERVTWERERAILEHIYQRADENFLATADPDGSGEDQLGAERRRVTGVYRRYAASSRKRRGWSATNPGNAAIRAELVGAVFDLAGATLGGAESILDVGCGSGWWLELLAGRRAPGTGGPDLYGLELLADRGAAAGRRVPSAQIATGDARALPYPDAGFDAVTLFTVLSSLATRADAERALSQARRVLRPGGVLLVWEPRLRNPLNGATLFISPALLASRLPTGGTRARLTTVAPPLARRLGARTDQLYPRLASIKPLLTHRLVCAREP